ncbi:hypothetical protein NHQ30_002353 [Ciborinia camelliae]|nr:hypothetical protein NHQ30_002353 [Ciborinia camelliae]
MDEDDTSLADVNLDIYEEFLHKIHNLASNLKRSIAWLDKDIYETYVYYDTSPRFQNEPESCLIWRVLHSTYKDLTGDNNLEDEELIEFKSHTPKVVPKIGDGFGKVRSVKAHIPRGYTYISAILQAAKQYELQRKFSNDLREQRQRMKERYLEELAKKKLAHNQELRLSNEAHAGYTQKLKAIEAIISKREEEADFGLLSSPSELPLPVEDVPPLFGFSEGIPRYSIEITGIENSTETKLGGNSVTYEALDVYMEIYGKAGSTRTFILVEPFKQEDVPSPDAIIKCQKALWILYCFVDKIRKKIAIPRYFTGFVKLGQWPSEPPQDIWEAFLSRNSNANASTHRTIEPLSPKKRKLEDATANIPEPGQTFRKINTSTERNFIMRPSKKKVINTSTEKKATPPPPKKKTKLDDHNAPHKPEPSRTLEPRHPSPTSDADAWLAKTFR